MAKWYIPKRNEQEKDEEKDKFAQQVSDPFHRSANRSQERAESIIKTPQKSVTDNNQPSPEIEEPAEELKKNISQPQSTDNTPQKSGMKQNANRWYVTEGRDKDGVRTKTFESEEARRHRLGDEAVDTGYDRYALAHAWDQTDKDQSLFDRYKQLKASAKQEEDRQHELRVREAEEKNRQDEKQIAGLSEEEVALLDKYNSQFTHDRPYTTEEKKIAKHYYNVDLDSEPKQSKEDVKEEFMAKTGMDEEAFDQIAHIRDLQKNAEDREEQRASLKDEMDNKSVAGMIFNTQNAATVLGNNLGGVAAFAGTMQDIFSDRDKIDTNRYTWDMTNQARDYREAAANEIQERHGGVASFAYQIGMSSVDSAASYALGDLGIALMSTSAAANTLQDAQNRGLDRNHALATAVAAGAVEYAFEKMGHGAIERVLRDKGEKGLMKVLKMFLKGGLPEGEEEGLTDIAYAAADAIINGDMSEYNQNVKAYEKAIKEYNKNNGIHMSDKEVLVEANKRAASDFAKQVGLDSIGGFAASVPHVGIAFTQNRIITAVDAKEMFKDGNYADFAEGIDTERNSYKTEKDWEYAKRAKEKAERLAQKYEAGEKISLGEQTSLLDLIYENQNAAQRAQEPERQTYFDRLANRFNDLVDGQNRANNETADDAGQSTDNVAQNTDNAPQENRRVAPVQSDITQEETVSRMSQAKTAEELGAVYNEAKNSVHEDVRKMADNLYDTYAGKLQSEGVSPEALRQGRISEQEAYEAGREGRDIGKLNPKLAEAYRRGAKETFLEEKEVTAKGAGAVTNDGSEVEISKIIDTTEGKIETSDGTILPMTEIHFRDKGMQKLYNAAMEYHSPSSAQVFIEAYPAGVPVNSYISAANEVYNRGRLGISLGDYMSRRGWLVNRLGQDTIDKLYNAGKAEKEATSRENKSMEGKKTAKGGHVIDTRENKDRSHPIYRLAKDMSAKLGVDIELTENDSVENGSYNPEKARIILNMNSDNGVLNTFFHEAAGEYAEAWNNNGMGEIQDLILDWWMSTHPEEIDNLIRRYQSAYIKHGGSKSYREAANEAVNDALAGLFSTPEGINDFVEWLESDTKKNVQTQTVLERIANFIKDLIDKLNNYIKGHPEISEASRRTMQMSADQAAGLRARILDVLDEARTKAAQAETAENTDQGEVRHSVKITLPDGREVEYLGDVLDMAEHKQFMGEIDKYPKSKYQKAANGDVIVPINNKLVYTDFRKSDPGISQIIVFNTDNYSRIDGATYIIYKMEKGKFENGECWEIIEDFCGEGFISRYNASMFEEGKKYDRQAKRGKRRSDAYHSEQQQRRREFYFESEDAGSSLNTSDKQQTPKSRNSLSISNVDSDGRMLSAEQQAYFKDSKIRDDQGRLITVYHGTPYGGFTVFKNDLNYFTPSQDYAERYHSPSASSIRGKYDPATNEMTYKGYLNITHPFDITDPETRNLFINDYVKGGWSASINPSLSDAEIEARIRDGIDWTEADNIKDFIDENELDYDGIILDEGAGGGYEQEVVDHGISYVTFNSNQFKNADNKNPTDNEDIRFSLEMPVEKAGNLIAIHNLTTDQMRETLKLGGFPMPSIAVTRADMGHNMYGNVSVLFRKNTIDPKESRYNKVYSGDAYTPEFPNIGYKINSDKILDIRQQVKDLIGEEYELFTNTGLDTDNAKDILERNSGNVVDGYGNKDALKYAFAKAKGIDIDLPTREENLSSSYDNDVIKYLALMFTPDQALNDYQKGKEAYEEYQKDGRLQKILDKINSFEKKMYSPKLYERMKTDQLEYFKFDMLLNSIVKYLRHGVETKLDRLAFSNSINEIINNNRAEYDAWLNDLFDGVIEKKGIRNNKDMFTPSGNRRKWESLYDDFNLTNIVNAMRKEDQTGKGFGGYSFFGSVNREFDSIDDIHSEENRLKLIDQEEYSNLQKEIANELHDIALRLKPGMGYDEYSIMSDIAEAVAKRKTISGVKNFLSQWYKVSDKDIADIMGLVKRVNELPTGYFEAKPQRAVGLDEIASVVVPDLETDLIDELKDKKVPYKTYKAGDKESRKEAVNSVEDIRFSLSIDSEGRELSEEQQQFFKDSKIRDAEGRLRVVYHGTNNTEFNVFDPDYIGSASGDDGFFGRGFYFAYYPGEASYYGSRRIIPAYLNITRPFDFETELHEYKGEKAKYDYAPDAVAFMNFAEKFPEIANDMTISIARPGSYDMEDIGLIEFANAFKDVINNKEFEYQTIKNEYGEDETLVLADPKEETYEYNGKTHTHISYGFQKRFYNDAPHLDVAYAYLSSNVYSYVNMYNFTRAILDNNEEFTETLKSREYDGVIQSEGGDEAVAFYPEQIKRIDNLNPTEDPDIRHSLSGIDTDILSGPIKYSIGDDILDDLFNGTLEEVTFADEDPGSTESYRRNIDTTVANLSRMLEAANAPLRGHSVDYQRIGKIADRIKDEYNSHISKQVLTNNLTTVFDYLQNNENIDYDDITRLLTEIAAPVLEKTGVEVPEAYQHFKQYVRSMPIKLSEQQKQELAYTYGSYASARKQNFGRINFSDEGTPIDRIWPELVRESAGLLDETANAGDMAHMLIDAVENCDHGYSELEMERGQNMAEASIDLAIDIMEEYYKAEADAIRSEAVNGVLESGMAGAAARESIDKARAQMKRQQEDFRKKTKEEYDARIKELEREAGQVDYYKAMADYNETVRKVEGQKSKAEIHRLMVELANTRRDLALKTKALQKDSVMNYKQRQDAAKTRKEITRIGNDLMKRILEPTSKKHVPTDLQKPLAEFLSGIDFVSHRSKEDSKNTKTWRERMQTLSIYLSQLEDGRIEDDLGLQAVLDPDLNADIRDFIKDTEGYARVSQLDAKHLKDLLGILKRLQVAINKSDTLYLNNTYKKVSDLAVATRNEMEEKKTRRPMFTMQGIAYNTVNISMLDPTSYFEEMGEAPKSVFKTFRNGFDQRAWHLKEAQEYMEKVLEGISQKDLAQWSRDKYTFNVSDGEITLTITQIMSLYELMKRDQAREHIMRGGIKADVREEGRWLKKSYTQNKPVHITPENFLTIIGKLTDEQKEVADAMQRFMATQCAEWGNHTTEQMYGYKKFTEKNYYPIKTDKNTIAANDKNTGDNGSLYHLRNLGMTKDLTPHAKNAIVLSDIFNVFSDHVADMATYDGMVMPLSDAMRWFNFKVTSEIMDEAAEFGSISDMWSIQEEIERVLGTPGKAYFTNLIKDINGMTPKAYDTQLADKLISNYKAAAVGANVRVIVQQPTAILRAANEMSPKYLARVLNPVTIAQSGKLAQKAKDNSAIAWWKGQGYFETSIGQSMRQMITGEATMGETIREYANKGAQVADDLTWGLIWRATELEIKDKRPELEYGSKEFNEAVTERFNDIVDRTQVVDTVLHRTQLMRSKSDINKLEMAFMAEPMKSYNMLHRAWKSGNKKTLARAATTFVLTNILTAAAAAIVDAFRKDDDETPWLDRYLTALKENIIDNLNPLNMFPYLKDVSSAMQGFENGRMDIEGINNLVQSLGQLEKFVKGDSKKTPYGMLKSLSKGISQLSGIPAYSLIRTFESIYNTFFDNLQTTVTSDYSYAYTAIDKNGDIEGELQKLIDKGKNPDSIAAALTKHYKNEYIALPEEERQEMKEKLLKAYEAAGKDYEKNIDKWVTNADKTEEPTSKNNSQDDSQNEEVAPVQEEYTSDYAGVYDAIDKGGNIQAEVQSMLDSGKQKSGVKSAITRHYKDDYLAASGSEKANMKNTLIKAYTAAGYTREEAISTIEGW